MLVYSHRLAGKVALITGAASGIGKTTAKEFINNGARVIIADVQQELGQKTTAELGPNAAFVRCDVTQEQHLSDAVDFAVNQHGQLDIMFNNAGISGPLNSIADLDMDGFYRLMRVNLYGVMAGIKHAARVMIPRKTGCILCSASVSGVIGGGVPCPYSISKFALVGAVKAVSSELCKDAIRINSISPFYVPSTSVGIEYALQLFPGVSRDRILEMMKAAGVLKGAVCEEEDVAKAALYLASDEAKYISGHNLVVDGGYSAFKEPNLSNPL